MTRTQIAAAVRRYLGQPGTEFVTDTRIYDSINQAMNDINQTCEFNRADVTIAMVTGTREYTIASTVSSVYSVRYGSSRKKLDSTSRSDLFGDDPDWESATSGVPTKYYTDGMLIGLAPKPNSAAAGTVLYVRVLKDPTSLTTASQAPTWLPNGYHDAIAIAAALDIAQGYDAEAAASVRIDGLERRYVQRMAKIAALAGHRAREYQPKIRVSGYGEFTK